MARGPGAFLPIADFPFADHRRTRALDRPVVELTVTGGIRDNAEYVLAVIGPLDLVERQPVL